MGRTHGEAIARIRARTHREFPHTSPGVPRPDGTALFVAQPTGIYRRTLRRFSFSNRRHCPRNPTWGCDATRLIGHVLGDGLLDRSTFIWPRDDPRWPAACAACGQPFQLTDEWQMNENELFRCPNGYEFSMWGGGREMPAGAMVRAHWWDTINSHPQRVTPWWVALPNGHQWITCQEATGGGYWTVTGEPPNITVSPSIHAAPGSPKSWHGFIRNGRLEGC